MSSEPQSSCVGSTHACICWWVKELNRFALVEVILELWVGTPVPCRMVGLWIRSKPKVRHIQLEICDTIWSSERLHWILLKTGGWSWRSFCSFWSGWEGSDYAGLGLRRIRTAVCTYGWIWYSKLVKHCSVCSMFELQCKICADQGHTNGNSIMSIWHQAQDMLP